MGLEQQSKSAEIRSDSETYAPAYAKQLTSQVVDQDLAELISSWRQLSDAAKHEVSRIVRAALAKEGGR